MHAHRTRILPTVGTLPDQTPCTADVALPSHAGLGEQHSAQLGIGDYPLTAPAVNPQGIAGVGLLLGDSHERDAEGSRRSHETCPCTNYCCARLACSIHARASRPTGDEQQRIALGILCCNCSRIKDHLSDSCKNRIFMNVRCMARPSSVCVSVSVSTRSVATRLLPRPCRAECVRFEVNDLLKSCLSDTAAVLSIEQHITNSAM